MLLVLSGHAAEARRATGGRGPGLVHEAEGSFACRCRGGAPRRGGKIDPAAPPACGDARDQPNPNTGWVGDGPDRGVVVVTNRASSTRGVGGEAAMDDTSQSCGLSARSASGGARATSASGRIIAAGCDVSNQPGLAPADGFASTLSAPALPLAR